MKFNSRYSECRSKNYHSGRKIGEAHFSRIKVLEAMGYEEKERKILAAR
jgi:hypothetical protein